MKSITTVGAMILASGLLMTTQTFAAEANNTANMKVYRDSKTGQLKEAEHDEAAKTDQAQIQTPTRVKRSLAAMPMAEPAIAPEPQTRRTRSGGTAMQLGPEHLNYSVAVRQTDGSIDVRCVEGKAAADALRQTAQNEKNDKKTEQNHDH
ncbi:hypothetical protein HNQ59_003004 [Chitinivorax tropicus]|uniref:DUF4148 domain-containing protein n=1 Tax=Chitinivorax tropicus TaxID=714531 RepID=A0A840MTJ8_9PROT|nr:hypothetical protein [Chitinivorax tropicus]MBB5019696.1 hypothetical protein [Chitinivorax tropicus]